MDIFRSIQTKVSRLENLKGSGKGFIINLKNTFVLTLLIAFNSIADLPKKASALLTLMFIGLSSAMAQGPSIEDGATALEGAAESIGTYFDPIANLIYAMGAIIALIGAIRVYLKWQSGDPDVIKAAAGWFGASIFLLLIVSLVKSFFGLE